jgi:hypothetical protein
MYIFVPGAVPLSVILPSVIVLNVVVPCFDKMPLQPIHLTDKLNGFQPYPSNVRTLYFLCGLQMGRIS